MKYKIMKVFDCQDMPDDLCSEFLEMWDNKSNDSSVEWPTANTVYADKDDPTRRIDEWLLEGGAEKYEDVIIKYWW